jgi:hypothetical protein
MNDDNVPYASESEARALWQTLTAKVLDKDSRLQGLLVTVENDEVNLVTVGMAPVEVAHLAAYLAESMGTFGDAPDQDGGPLQ